MVLFLTSEFQVHGQQRPPLVAAAADLQFALTESAALFEQESGHSLRLNFGSSSSFWRQIAQGTPFEVYLSADESYVLALHQEAMYRMKVLSMRLVALPGYRAPARLNSMKITRWAP